MPANSAPPVESVAMPAADAARFIGVSSSHFYALAKTGRLPLPVRMGRCVRWRRAELSAWIDAGCPALERWNVMRGGVR